MSGGSTHFFDAVILEIREARALINSGKVSEGVNDLKNLESKLSLLRKEVERLQEDMYRKAMMLETRQ